MQQSVSFKAKYLDNKHVLARCFLLLEGRIKEQLQIPQDDDINGLSTQLSISLSRFITDIVDDRFILSDYAKSLTGEREIELTAFVGDVSKECYYMACEVNE